MKQLICSIFRSPKIDEMYLYLAKDSPFGDLPMALMERFGTPQHVMTMLLNTKRKLARVDSAEVLAMIEKHGYYLQMPPPPEMRLDRNSHD